MEALGGPDKKFTRLTMPWPPTPQDVLLMAAQTREERERAASLRQAKEEDAMAKRAKLKQDFLQQQLAKLRAAQQQQQKQKQQQ